MATLGALAFSQYSRHQRIRHAEEPIGVPIGVPETTSSSAPTIIASAPTVAPAPPAIANAPSVASAPVQPEPPAPTTAAQEHQPRPAAVEPTAAVIASDRSSVAPIQSEATAAPVTSEPADQPRVAANEPDVSRETISNPHPTDSIRPEIREPEPSRDREVDAAVPTARPVSPEVRRAEPPPPAEGPDDAMPAQTEKKVVTNWKPKKEHTKKPKREPEEETITRTEPAADDRVADTSLSQLPRGRTRARFIGVTADGNWMFSLPSTKIGVVPAPPGG